MATFTGTFGADNFVGTDNVKDTFKFDADKFASYDVIVGGNGTTIDTLQFTTAGSFTGPQFNGVSGIEKVVLFGASTIEMNAAMFDTAKGHLIEVVGSSQNDTVYGLNATQPTARLQFDAGAGNDVFVGTSGDDTVQIAAADWNGKDFLSAGLSGMDTLELTTAGAVDALATVNLHGFDKIVLNAGGNSLYVHAAAVGSADAGTMEVEGAAGDDTVICIDAITRVVFSGHGGTNMFIGGSGADKATGGAGNDTFNGEGGNDTLNGVAGFDHLYGFAGNDRISLGTGTGSAYGGDGADRISSAVGGHGFLQGDSNSDTLIIHAGDGGNADVLFYALEADGGVTGDKVQSDGGSLLAGDLYFQFDQRAGQFDTNGAFDKIVTANGSESTGMGNAVDGADLILYDGNGVGGTVLGSVGAIDSYLFNHYYASTTAGIFLAEKNPSGTITIYYDHDAYHSTGGIQVIATIQSYSGSVGTLSSDFGVIT